MLKQGKKASLCFIRQWTCLRCGTIESKNLHNAVFICVEKEETLDFLKCRCHRQQVSYLWVWCRGTSSELELPVVLEEHPSGRLWWAVNPRRAADSCASWGLLWRRGIVNMDQILVQIPVWDSSSLLIWKLNIICKAPLERSAASPKRTLTFSQNILMGAEQKKSWHGALLWGVILKT